MVLAHHLIWTVYGWWLPNDPRGSSSREIRVEPLKPLGEIHHGRKKVQPAAKDLKAFHARAQDELKHEVLLLTDDDIAAVGAAVGEVIRDWGYMCYEAAVMPEHVHLLIRRHRDSAETMLEIFQTVTREKLVAATRALTHPVWGGKGWKVFQSSPEQILRTIAYIRDNPVKAGREPQRWPFVTPYDGWEPPFLRRDGRF